MSTLIPNPVTTFPQNSVLQENDNASCGCGCCFGSRAMMLRKRAPEAKQAPVPAVMNTGTLSQNKRSLPPSEILRISANTLAGIVVAFFPKCPICWAGYMSLFGAIGLKSIPYTPQVLFLFIAGMAANLYVHYRISQKKKRMNAFFLNLAGVALVISGYISGIALLNYAGLISLAVSSLLINFQPRFFGRTLLAR